MVTEITVEHIPSKSLKTGQIFCNSIFSKTNSAWTQI